MSTHESGLPRRVGLIVPSSNVTMEREVPTLLQEQTKTDGERFSVHSNRVRMQHVERDELVAMNRQASGAVVGLNDAAIDVLVYACLVAAMADPRGYLAVEADLEETLRGAGGAAPVISSAGALLGALDYLQVGRVALLAPYMPNLTDVVIDCIESHGVKVVDSVSLGVPDNLAVAALDPVHLPGHVRELDTNGADALIVSACVQMPSLQVVGEIEDDLGIPVLSAATATVWAILTALGFTPHIPGAGRLLAS